MSRRTVLFLAIALPCTLGSMNCSGKQGSNDADGGSGAGGSTTSSGGAAGTSGSGAAGSGTGGAGGSSPSDGGTVACNTLVNDGAVVTATSSMGTARTPMGGMVTDGTYALSSITLYSTLPTNITLMASSVIRITGNMIQVVQFSSGRETRYTSTFTTSGSTITTLNSCPAVSSGMAEFTATPATLSLYARVRADTVEQTYTKR